MEKDTKKAHTISQGKHKQAKKRLGKWIDTHRESGQWLLYKDHDGNFYSRGSHNNTEWKVYKCAKKVHN